MSSRLADRGGFAPFTIDVHEASDEVLRPKLTQATVAFSIDGVPYAVEAWSDMTALEVVRLAVGRAAIPSRCESGICGTCESMVDGQPVRLCATGAGRIEGSAITLKS